MSPIFPFRSHPSANERGQASRGGEAAKGETFSGERRPRDRSSDEREENFIPWPPWLEQHPKGRRIRPLRSPITLHRGVEPRKLVDRSVANRPFFHFALQCESRKIRPKPARGQNVPFFVGSFAPFRAAAIACGIGTYNEPRSRKISLQNLHFIVEIEVRSLSFLVLLHKTLSQ